MDPNATLELMRSIVRFTRGPSADMQTPAELLEGLVRAVDRLDESLSRGSFLPNAWTKRRTVGTLEPIVVDGVQEIVLHWSTQHGTCHECGLPAAFYLPLAYVRGRDSDEPPTETNKRCAMCAADAAAEGEVVRRNGTYVVTDDTQPRRPEPEPEPTEVVVTVEGGGATRKYVVVEDQELFDEVPSGPVPKAEGTPAAGGATRPPTVHDVRMARERHLGRFGFGARWLRGYGRVDEMFRSLATCEVVKVERIPRSKVWGE